jgi:hypothetical protein
MEYIQISDLSQYNSSPKLQFINGYLYIENVFVPANFTLTYTRDMMFKNIDGVQLVAQIQPPLFKSPDETLKLSEFMSILYFSPIVIATERMISENVHPLDNKEIIKFIGVVSNVQMGLHQPGSSNITLMAVDILNYLLMQTTTYLYKNLNLGLYTTTFQKNLAQVIQEIFLESLNTKDISQVFKKLLVHIGAYTIDIKKDFQLQNNENLDTSILKTEKEKTLTLQNTCPQFSSNDFLTTEKIDEDTFYISLSNLRIIETGDATSRFFINKKLNISEFFNYYDVINKLKEKEVIIEKVDAIVDDIINSTLFKPIYGEDIENTLYYVINKSGIQYLYNNNKEFENFVNEMKNIINDNIKFKNFIRNLFITETDLSKEVNAFERKTLIRRLQHNILPYIQDEKSILNKDLKNAGLLDDNNQLTDKAKIILGIWAGETSFKPEERKLNNSGAYGFSQFVIFQNIDKIGKYIKLLSIQYYELNLDESYEKLKDAYEKLKEYNFKIIGCYQDKNGNIAFKSSNPDDRIKCIKNNEKDINPDLEQKIKNYILLEQDFVNRLESIDKQELYALDLLIGNEIFEEKMKKSENDLLKSIAFYIGFTNKNLLFKNDALRRYLSRVFYVSKELGLDLKSNFGTVYLNKDQESLLNEILNDNQQLQKLKDKLSQKLDIFLSNLNYQSFTTYEDILSYFISDSEISQLSQINENTKLVEFPFVYFTKLRNFVLKSILFPKKVSMYNILSKSIVSNLSIFDIKENIYSIGTLVSNLLQLLNYRITVFPPKIYKNRIIMYSIIPSLDYPMVPLNTENYIPQLFPIKNNLLNVDIAQSSVNFNYISSVPTTTAVLLNIMSTPLFIVLPLSKVVETFDKLKDKTTLPTDFVTRFSTIEYYRLPYINFTATEDLITLSISSGWTSNNEIIRDRGLYGLMLYVYSQYLYDFWRSFAYSDIGFITTPLREQPYISFPLYVNIPGFGIYGGILKSISLQYTINSMYYSYNLLNTYQLESFKTIIPFIEPLFSDIIKTDNEDAYFFDWKLKKIDLSNLYAIKKVIEQSNDLTIDDWKERIKYENHIGIRKLFHNKMIEIYAPSIEIGITHFTENTFIKVDEKFIKTLQNNSKNLEIIYSDSQLEKNAIFEYITFRDDVFTIDDVQRKRP